jgi:hypothetical protein
VETGLGGLQFGLKLEEYGQLDGIHEDSSLYLAQEKFALGGDLGVDEIDIVAEHESLLHALDLLVGSVDFTQHHQPLPVVPRHLQDPQQILDFVVPHLVEVHPDANAVL